MRSLITTVQSQIKELNDALSDVRFGRDRYRFTVEPNKDYIDYYNMMMDPLFWMMFLYMSQVVPRLEF